jgi:hypothetical protein
MSFARSFPAVVAVACLQLMVEGQGAHTVQMNLPGLP